MTMTIAAVSEKYNISQDTLRYYERIGLIPRVNRNKSGFRDYTEEDCNWVDFILCMRQNAGLPVDTLIEYVELFQHGDQTQEARKELLVDQRRQLAARIEEMTTTLSRLDDKIARYEQTIAIRETTLAKTSLTKTSKVES